jgi:demethylmenaquinone methyltransferase / 2-methoxy-6-polyprenyl-1,4-benzoquinol methylase
VGEIVNEIGINRALPDGKSDEERQSLKNVHASRLFDGIADNYDRPAQIFSFFQYLRWREFLVSRLRLEQNSKVLDVCTGPGGVAIAIARSAGCQVIGVDISDKMLEKARRNILSSNLTATVSVEKARAENLPFDDRTFDAVVFTFLLRYVDEPRTVLKELARVLKPGKQLVSLEFYTPRGPILHPLWLLHTRLVLPLGTRFIDRGWSEVGSFLGPSISEFFHRQSLEDLIKIWTNAGLIDVQTKILSLGGAFVMWGQKADGR